MGRANYPTRSVLAERVKPGDVVLIRYPAVDNSRWMIVDSVNTTAGPPAVWSGRWAFGDDAGVWTIQRADHERYTMKDTRDARYAQARLAKIKQEKLTEREGE